MALYVNRHLSTSLSEFTCGTTHHRYTRLPYVPVGGYYLTTRGFFLHRYSLVFASYHVIIHLKEIHIRTWRKSWLGDRSRILSFRYTAEEDHHIVFNLEGSCLFSVRMWTNFHPFQRSHREQREKSGKRWASQRTDPWSSSSSTEDKVSIYLEQAKADVVWQLSRLSFFSCCPWLKRGKC